MASRNPKQTPHPCRTTSPLDATDDSSISLEKKVLRNALVIRFGHGKTILRLEQVNLNSTLCCFRNIAERLNGFQHRHKKV